MVCAELRERLNRLSSLAGLLGHETICGKHFLLFKMVVVSQKKSNFVGEKKD